MEARDRDDGLEASSGVLPVTVPWPRIPYGEMSFRRVRPDTAAVEPEPAAP